jgi:hypothetical protein
MRTKTVKLTETDLKVLDIYFWEHPCSCGCIYKEIYGEMPHKKIDCDDCPFTEDALKLREKLFEKD